jgi:hypothetical protein
MHWIELGHGELIDISYIRGFRVVEDSIIINTVENEEFEYACESKDQAWEMFSKIKKQLMDKEQQTRPSPSVSMSYGSYSKHSCRNQ